MRSRTGRALGPSTALSLRGGPCASGPAPARPRPVGPSSLATGLGQAQARLRPGSAQPSWRPGRTSQLGLDLWPEPVTAGPVVLRCCALPLRCRRRRGREKLWRQRSPGDRPTRPVPWQSSRGSRCLRRPELLRRGTGWRRLVTACRHRTDRGRQRRDRDRRQQREPRGGPAGGLGCGARLPPRAMAPRPPCCCLHSERLSQLMCRFPM